MGLNRLRFKLRTWWPLWRHVLNGRPHRLWRMSRPKLDDLQLRLLTELRTTGFSRTSLDELFPDEDWLDRLSNLADRLEMKATPNAKKPFLKMFWSDRPRFELDNPFVQLSIHPRILDTVNSYMQMYSKVNYFHLARSCPVGNRPAEHSQLWHRDPDEPRMCKMFVYLNQVDEAAGPFVFIPRSVRGQKWGRYFRQKPPLGSYPPPEQVDQILQREKAVTMCGPPGTVILCDTTGLHRGGYATEKDRVMFTTFYTSICWSETQRYEPFEGLKSLPPAARFALEQSGWTEMPKRAA